MLRVISGSASGSWNRGGIKLVKLDKNTGKLISSLTTIGARQRAGPEAPYLHYRDGYYYLFQNEGTCCNGMNVTYHIMMGRSKTITGPYLDKEGRDLARGGGSSFLGTDGAEIGPGHMGIFTEDGIGPLHVSLL
jgi:arabinan endo-1,5-alpha-L-arabinosidase